MQLKCTPALVFGLTLSVITPILQADPIRGTGPPGFDHPHAINLMLEPIWSARHRGKQEKTGGSEIAPAGGPAGVGFDGTRGVPVAFVDTIGGTDLAVWNEMGTGSSGNPTVWNERDVESLELDVWNQNASKRITAGNLDPLPESNPILPLGLLAAGLLLFRNRLLATR